MESKEDLFRRQSRDQRPQRSPDRADAVLGAMGRLPVLDTVSLGGNSQQRGPWHDDPDMGGRTEEAGFSVPEEVLRGFDAGG